MLLDRSPMAARISGANLESVVIAAGNARLSGMLLSPSRPLGVVLVADVSGSTFFSPWNLLIAHALESAAFASLLVNLLSASEAAVDAHTGWLRKDPELLAGRITAARRWLGARPDTQDLPLGLFGAGPASSAALIAAADTLAFGAIVCCPDEIRPAAEGLEGVLAPTLLITGMEERQLRAADRILAALQCPRELAVVPGASRRFEEPGALDAIAELSRRWFERHLARGWIAAQAT